MRFLISSIFTIFILSIPSVVFGKTEEIKDIGVICRLLNIDDELPHHIGIWFERYKRMEWYLRDKDDFDEDGITSEFKKNGYHTMNTQYKTNEEYIFITFWENGKEDKETHWTINRFTMEMVSGKSVSEVDRMYGIDQHPTLKWNCKSVPTKKRFLFKLSELEKRYEKLLGERKI